MRGAGILSNIQAGQLYLTERTIHALDFTAAPVAKDILR